MICNRTWTLVVLLLAGCTVGPNYQAPDMHTPVNYQEAQTKAPMSQPSAAQSDIGAWWSQISDDTLKQLIARAMVANLDIQTALSRVRQARAQITIAHAAELPQVGASGLGAKLHSDSNPLAGLNGSSGAASSGVDFSTFSAGLDATWEIDIFGGGRRAVEAAKANVDAAVWQLRDAQVSLTAEIANDYMMLRSAQVRLDVLGQRVEREKRVLDTIKARAQTGFLTQLDVNQQTAAVAAVAARIPDVQAEVRVTEHALAVLMAEEPEALTAELDRAAPLSTLPPTLPVGLPSDLLRRRPDIRTAERKLAAATAEEGVAIAALYPKFNLLGLVSAMSGSFSGLLSDPHASEIAVGQISWPIFNGGKIKANIKIKREDTQQAYFSYRASVLGAVRDVEDALVRYSSTQRQRADIETAVAGARSSVDIALQQYRSGLVNYASVLTAQSQYNDAEDQLTQNGQALAQDVVALFKALGGGWTVEPQG